MRDLNAHLSVVQSLAPQSVDADGSVDGADVDLANFDSAVAIGNAGLWATDGSYIFVLQHADDDGTGAPDTYADVPAASVDGAFTAVTATTNDNVAQQVGYLGNKRWLRVRLTTSGNTSGTFVGGAVIARGNGRKVS